MNEIVAQHHPAEIIDISPEALEIANCYLQFQDSTKVAELLDIPVQTVTQTLNRREVRTYIDSIFMELGYNNRFKLRSLIDTIITKKLQEMDEADIGSNKDILDILTLSHKMTMEYLDKQIKLEELKNKQATANLKSQVNVQINNDSSGSNYGNLIERIISASSE